MTFSELAQTLEAEHDALMVKMKKAIKAAADRHDGGRPLSRRLGMSGSYIPNLITQKQTMTALLKGVQAIDAMFKGVAK